MVPRGSTLVQFLLLVAVSCCYGNNEKVEVVGVVECSDCGKNNYVKFNQFFSGLHVTVDCKTGDTKSKTKGASKVDEEGTFKISLTNYDVTNKNDCFVNLQSSFGAQCIHSQSKAKSSKLIFLSKSNEKLTLGLNETLKFSISTCTSAFFWPFKCPPLSHLPTWPKFPPPGPIELPFTPPPSPTPIYESNIPPPISQPQIPTPQPAPVYQNIVPPPSPRPIFNKPAPLPAPKHCPPTTPAYEKPLPPPSPSPFSGNPVPLPAPKLNPPTTPAFKKPLPPPIPVYKKPLPPPAPTFKKPLVSPPTLKSKHPLPPTIPKVQKPFPPLIPPFKKPLPPVAPTYKKPLPPPSPFVSNNPPTPQKSHLTFPKPPPVPSLPPASSVPRKILNKPKNGNQLSSSP